MDNKTIALTVAAGAALYVTFGRPSLKLPGVSLDRDGIFALAKENNAQIFGLRLDPKMVTTIAFIESSFNPTAVRVEAARGDASVGLMQTLVGTAQWLHDVHNYRLWDVRPDFTKLFDVEQSMFYGMAYLDYLKTKNGITRGREDETIVRAYNGGPGGSDKSYTDGYWVKYQRARAELF